MKAQEQIPRNALVWIFISLFALVLPHVQRIPLWVLAVFVIAAVWRILVYRGRWSYPRWPVKLVLISAAFAGVLLSFRSLIGLEPTVALLLVAFALKQLELKSRKDAYVLLFLGYFVILTEFLFSQDLLVVLFCFLNVIIVTTALVALHRPGEDQFSVRPMRKASVMVMQSVPLMLVLFFLFPRVGPLWTIPMKSHSARTGMSDFMKPGDVSQLSRSGEVAFRVQFEGDIPPRSQLYWRGLVMSKLQGGAWRTLDYYEVPSSERRPADPVRQGEPLRYTVIMEPTQQRWLYSLRYARSPERGVMNSADFRLFRPTVVEDDFRYQVRSWPDSVLEPALSDWRRRTELKLPSADNPRTRALAQEFAAAASSDREVVQAVLTLFNREPFTYTLQPPLLPEADPVDAFLFGSRRGFCEHFATSFVTLMRAAGVPARVVAGYQGGEINPINRTVIVHQFDAHAWAEVWLDGEGWMRVDPTSAVAPERIEFGLEQAVAEEGTFLADSPLSLRRYSGINLVNQLRLRYDALTYQWQTWVTGFDRDQQFEFLHGLMGEFTARKFAAILLGSGLLVMVPVALGLFYGRQSRKLSELDRLYLKFCNRLAALGVGRGAGEGPEAYCSRAMQQLPAVAGPIREVTDGYIDMAYAGAVHDTVALRRLRRLVRSIR